MNPAFTFDSLVSLIVKELELELVAMNRMSKHGVGNFSLPDESSFDVLVKSSSNSKIKIADGKPISIKGTRTICDKEAKFVPDFKTALVPPSAFTDLRRDLQGMIVIYG